MEQWHFALTCIGNMLFKLPSCRLLSSYGAHKLSSAANMESLLVMIHLLC